MASRVNLKGRDNSNELTTFGLYGVDVTAANFDAEVAKLDALQSAANGVSLGAFDGKQLNAVDVPPGTAAIDTGAQREGKWRVSYTDDVSPFGNGSFEIGMYDPALIAGGTQDMITGAARTALIDAVEAYVSRLGNPITVVSIKHVGRNT